MWSGGKDSALAAWRARAAGLRIGCLLNFIDAGSRRVRFHATRAELILAQAQAAGVPLRQYAATWPGFEAAVRDALAALVADGFAGVVFGDIHLADVRAWYEERVRDAGLAHVEPLWGAPPLALLDEFVSSGGRAVVTCCEEGKLDGSWLGRIIDERFVREIAALPVDPAGENGEYHSFAFAGPLFRETVRWLPGEHRREGGFVQLDLLEPLAALEGLAARTIAADEDLAEGTRVGRPKAWGSLAAKGVLAFRDAFGRAPNDSERRSLWDAVWRAAHAPQGDRHA